MQNKMVRYLTESAVFIAIATVLSMLKIDLPFGGGVTVVSMLPIVIISHRWGWRRGLVTAFVYSAIQLLLGLDNVGYASSFIMAAGIVVRILAPVIVHKTSDPAVVVMDQKGHYAISLLSGHDNIVAYITELSVFCHLPLKCFWLIPDELYMQLLLSVQFLNLILQLFHHIFG